MKTEQLKKQHTGSDL